MTTDKSKLVSEIRQLLSTKKILPELLVDVAAEYAEACATVNERLGAVGKLLGDGYRDEAIELAEQNPKLLYYMQLVDFPERAQWNALLAKSNVGTPTELLTNEAEQLELAYEEQRSLAPLMRQHRLLALSGAPLAARLRVLRRLAKQDPANPIWRDDIESFEHARLSQIQADIAKAKKTRDIDAMNGLVEELESDWSVALPKGLRESARQSVDALIRQNAREQMIPMATALNDCLSAFDVARGRTLRDKWNALAHAVQLTENDELIDQTREAMLWLAEADQQSDDDIAFNEAIAGLERALDDRIPLPDFERQLYAVQKFGREVPTPIARRAQQYHATLQLTDSRKSKLLFAGIGMGIVAVTASLFLYFSNRSRQQQIDEARNQLQTFVQTPNYSAAESYYASLTGAIKSDAETLRLWEKIQNQHREEVSRANDFEALISKIDTTGSLGPEIDQAIQAAQTLAAATEQASRIDTLKSQIQIERVTRQKNRNEQFLSELGILAERLRKIEQQPIERTDFSELTRLRADAISLRESHKHELDGMPAISASVLSQADQLVNRVDVRTRLVNEHTTGLKELGEITLVIGNVERFKNRLTSFADQHKTFPLSPDFLSVSAESAFWERFIGWRALADDTVWNNPLLIKGERAAQLLEQIKTLREKMALEGMIAAITPAEALLQNLVTAFAADAELPGKLDSLRQKYSRLEYLEQKVLVDDNGNFKYFAAEPKVKDQDRGKTWFYFWPDLKKDKQASELVDDRDLAKYKVGIAGQAVLADRIVKTIKNSNSELDRDAFVQELIKAAMGVGTDQPDVPIDPIVQAVMVSEILEIAVQHSLFWRDFATAGSAKLKELDILMIDWMEFKNPTTGTLRRQVKTALDELKTEYKAALPKVNSSTEQAKNVGKWRDQIDHAWVGWLYLLEGQWRIAGPNPIEENVTVFVLIESRGGTGPGFQPIGKHSNGLLIDPVGEGANKSGRPIYIRERTK